MIIIFFPIKSVNQFVTCHEISFVLLSKAEFNLKSNNQPSNSRIIQSIYSL